MAKNNLVPVKVYVPPEEFFMVEKMAMDEKRSMSMLYRVAMEEYVVKLLRDRAEEGQAA